MKCDPSELASRLNSNPELQAKFRVDPAGLFQSWLCRFREAAA
jgi:hypothetical protein